MSDDEIIDDEVIDIGDEMDLLDDDDDLDLDDETIDDKELDLKLSMGGFEE